MILEDGNSYLALGFVWTTATVAPTAPTGPVCFVVGQAWIDGGVAGQIWIDGRVAGQGWIDGSVAGQVNCC